MAADYKKVRLVTLFLIVFMFIGSTLLLSSSNIEASTGHMVTKQKTSIKYACKKRVMIDRDNEVDRWGNWTTIYQSNYVNISDKRLQVTCNSKPIESVIKYQVYVPSTKPPRRCDPKKEVVADGGCKPKLDAHGCTGDNVKVNGICVDPCKNGQVRNNQGKCIDEVGSEQAGGGGGIIQTPNYGGANVAASAGNSLSCKNVTNQFSKFYEYVNAKYKSVKNASDNSLNSNGEKWIAADEAMIAQRAKEDANMQASADKLMSLAGSSTTKKDAATKYIDELKAAVKENRNKMDVARSGVDLTTETVGKAEGESYRAQVLAAQGDKREDYLSFMKTLVKKYDNSVSATRKSCNTAALNKLKNDAKTFKSSYKTDLTKAREEYKKAQTTIRDEYKNQIGELNTNFKARTDTALQILLFEW